MKFLIISLIALTATGVWAQNDSGAQTVDCSCPDNNQNCDGRTTGKASGEGQPTQTHKPSTAVDAGN